MSKKNKKSKKDAGIAKHLLNFDAATPGDGQQTVPAPAQAADGMASPAQTGDDTPKPVQAIGSAPSPASAAPATTSPAGNAPAKPAPQDDASLLADMDSVLASVGIPSAKPAQASPIEADQTDLLPEGFEETDDLEEYEEPAPKGGKHGKKKGKGKHGIERSAGHKALKVVCIIIGCILAIVVAGGYYLWKFVLPMSGSLTIFGQTFSMYDGLQTYTPTPIIAEYDGLMIHCPVATKDLTEIMFHPNGYLWSEPLTTQLAVADAETTEENHGTGRQADQPLGDNWLIGSAVHVERGDAAGLADSSVDSGAAVDSTVYAPVTGTVTYVGKYSLYGDLDDDEIHIRPDGYPTLDVVVCHTTNVAVKAGDRVTAGVTNISFVRDICSTLEDVQIGLYTAESDAGNHVHIEVNDATAPGYAAYDGKSLQVKTSTTQSSTLPNESINGGVSTTSSTTATSSTSTTTSASSTAITSTSTTSSQAAN